MRFIHIRIKFVFVLIGLMLVLSMQSYGGKRPESVGDPSKAINDLPVVEVQAKDPELGQETMAIIITGDGGWVEIDKRLARVFSENGIPVAGLNSLRYFWKERTPETFAADMERMARHYLKLWGKNRIILAGYSRGADVLPFAVSRFPEELLSKVALVALLGPGFEASFKFYLGDIFNDTSKGRTFPTMPEVEKLYGLKMICVYGSDEKESLCRKINNPSIKVSVFSGGHHFGKDYETIAETILKETR